VAGPSTLGVSYPAEGMMGTVVDVVENTRQIRRSRSPILRQRIRQPLRDSTRLCGLKALTSA
jgi:hypothetical protein